MTFTISRTRLRDEYRVPSIRYSTRYPRRFKLPCERDPWAIVQGRALWWTDFDNGIRYPSQGPWRTLSVGTYWRLPLPEDTSCMAYGGYKPIRTGPAAVTRLVASTRIHGKRVEARFLHRSLPFQSTCFTHSKHFGDRPLKLEPFACGVLVLSIISVSKVLVVMRRGAICNH